MDGSAGGGLLGMSNTLNINQNPQGIELLQTSELDSERFQQLWMQLPVGCGGQPIQKSLRLDLQLTIQMIEQHALECKIMCMANGQLGTELKFFFHAQMADKSGFFMIEALFNLQSKILNYTIKSTRPDMEQAFNVHLTKTFSLFTLG